MQEVEPRLEETGRRYHPSLKACKLRTIHSCQKVRKSSPSVECVYVKKQAVLLYIKREAQWHLGRSSASGSEGHVQTPCSNLNKH